MSSAPARPAAPARSWTTRHPVLTFVGLTYGLSWTLWALAWTIDAPLGGPRWLAAIPFVLGGFGPPFAAWLLLRRDAEARRRWVVSILRWRVPLRYYLAALGLPILLFAVANVAVAMFGEPVEVGLVAERWPVYLATFAFTLVLGGALEEPGWRGYALPRLQQRFTPLGATAILGLAWGVWHVPIYGPLGFVVPFVLAFFYTWLYNRTGSVWLCILLHASFTPAQEHLLLLRDEVHGVTDLAIGIAYLGGVLVLLAMTRGRLGVAPSTRVPRDAPGVPRDGAAMGATPDRRDTVGRATR
jgi:uncharacterized protein